MDSGTAIVPGITQPICAAVHMAKWDYSLSTFSPQWFNGSRECGSDVIACATFVKRWDVLNHYAWMSLLTWCTQGGAKCLVGLIAWLEPPTQP